MNFLRLSIDFPVISWDFLRSFLRVPMDFLRISIDFHRISMDFLKISMDFLRVSIDVLTISIDFPFYINSGGTVCEVLAALGD